MTRNRSPIVVRAATEADLASVVALRLALVREEARRSGLRVASRPAQARARQMYSLQLANSAESTLLAFSGNRAIAVLRCTVSGDSSPVRALRYAFLTSAYVLPAFRRSGVMSVLLLSADDWCRERGLEEMRLQVQWDNVGGNAAWDALGFALLEVRRRRVVPKR